MKKMTAFSRSMAWMFLIIFVFSSVLLGSNQKDLSLLTLDRIF